MTMRVAPLGIPDDVLSALASGGGGPREWTLLRAARRNRNLLLLRGLYDRAARAAEARSYGTATGEAGAAEAVRQAWGFLQAGLDLLRTVERHARGVFMEVVDDPMTGAWLGCWAREAPLAEPAAHAAALAASAALRAGLAFRITVPVRDGAVVLPSLGLAVLPGAADTAEVTGDGRVVGPGGDVVVGGPADGGWHALPRLRCGAWAPQLDSLNPFRVGHHPVPPRVLDAAEVARWEDELGAAWALLAERHPERADEIGALQSSVVPLGGESPTVDGRGGWLSATLGDAVGHVALAPHPGTRALAAGLIHETQHSKLCALLDVVDLLDVPPGTRCYSPWREDPRPVSGLLQGAYAFLTVTEFWRKERAAPGGEVVPGDGFALRYEQVGGAVAELAGSDWLTREGRRFVTAMGRTLGSWADAAPEPRELGRALAVAAEHRVRWRLRHAPTPPPAAVHLLAEAHSAGRPAPATASPLPPDRWALPAAPPPPDTAHRAAELEARLSAPGAGTPEQWARLAALALLLADHRAPALAAAPELTRAVHTSARTAPCSPLDLAEWLEPALPAHGA